MYFIDVQGTLLSDSDKSLIKGAKELIDFLNQKDIPYIVITNNTKFISDDFLENLRSKGLEIKDNAYLDPFCVLKEILAPCNIAPFGAIEFKQTMQDLGYTLDYNDPKAILIASGNDFKFEDFALMNELALNGARLIAMHGTSIYKKNGRLYPGVGAITAMIRVSTSVGSIAVGKPSVAFYERALNLIRKQRRGAEFGDITIISDDAKGDLVDAKALNMKTNLVLSGKVSNPKKSGVDLAILDEIYPSVNEILENINAKY